MWPGTLSALLGVWLMAAPAVLGYDGLPADVQRIVGPVVAAVGIISLSGVARAFLRANLVPALVLVAASWFLGLDVLALVNSLITGSALGVLAIVGPLVAASAARFGGGWTALFQRVAERQQHLPDV